MPKNEMNEGSTEVSKSDMKIIDNVLDANPGLVLNAMATRSQLMQKLFDPRRDINQECGYPDIIEDDQYRRMYDRGLGRRVVNVFPEETWSRMPTIYEDADPKTNTAFEDSLEALEDKLHLLYYLQRADELSGIGHYGIILWGVNDGKNLSEEIDGWESWEEVTGNPNTSPGKNKIMYIRTLDESLVKISKYEEDKTSPRYGKPTSYTITLTDPRNVASGQNAMPLNKNETTVHWTRVTHIADNRTTSEVLGTPRMMPVWDRLYDLVKVLGGSGEMYWRGGFPGLSIETQPGFENATLDTEATKEALWRYGNGLQRDLTLTGMTARSLSPQIADPNSTFECQIKAICVILGVPYRVFMGIEEGVVAGDQATKAWHGRLGARQQRYVNPMIIEPVLQRLVAYGTLLPPKENNGWTVEWPELSPPTEIQNAETATKWAEAYSKYVNSGLEALIPPMEWFTVICKMPDNVAESIIDAGLSWDGNITGIDDEPEAPVKVPAALKTDKKAK